MNRDMLIKINRATPIWSCPIVLFIFSGILKAASLYLANASMAPNTKKSGAFQLIAISFVE